MTTQPKSKSLKGKLISDTNVFTQIWLLICVPVCFLAWPVRAWPSQAFLNSLIIPVVGVMGILFVALGYKYAAQITGIPSMTQGIGLLWAFLWFCTLPLWYKVIPYVSATYFGEPHTVIATVSHSNITRQFSFGCRYQLDLEAETFNNRKLLCVSDADYWQAEKGDTFKLDIRSSAMGSAIKSYTPIATDGSELSPRPHTPHRTGIPIAMLMLVGTLFIGLWIGIRSERALQTDDVEP